MSVYKRCLSLGYTCVLTLQAIIVENNIDFQHKLSNKLFFSIFDRNCLFFAYKQIFFSAFISFFFNTYFPILYFLSFIIYHSFSTTFLPFPYNVYKKCVLVQNTIRIYDSYSRNTQNIKLQNNYENIKYQERT